MKNESLFLKLRKKWCEKKVNGLNRHFVQMIALIKMFMQTSSRLNKDFNKVVVWSQVRVESRPSGNALKVECAN